MGEGQNLVELSSVALTPPELRDLWTTLADILHNQSIKITILAEGKERQYNSFDAIFSDELIPDVVRSFELQFKSRGGRGRITANSSEGDVHRLYLDGFGPWRIQVAERIKQFMRSRKNSIRTFFSSSITMAPISLLSSILAGNFYVTISPVGIFYPSESILPLLYASYAITAAIFFASAFRHRMFPYAYWELTEDPSINLYITSIFKILALVLLTMLTLPAVNAILS